MRLRGKGTKNKMPNSNKTKENQMNKQLEKMLKLAPSIHYAEPSLRYDSVSNYIEDLEHQLYWWEEEEQLEMAKDDYLVAKRSEVREGTLKHLWKTWQDAKLEYTSLKKHLDFIKKSKK